MLTYFQVPSGRNSVPPMAALGLILLPRKDILMLQAFHLEMLPAMRAQADSAIDVLKGPLRENFIQSLAERGVIRVAIWHIAGLDRHHVFGIIEAPDPQLIVDALFHPSDDSVMEWSKREAAKVTGAGEEAFVLQNPVFDWRAE
jgi:hypothetical protein